MRYYNAGLQFQNYPYYNSKNKGFRFERNVTNISTPHEKSIVLLHVAAHNPTGVDPTEEQWAQIADVMKSKTSNSLLRLRISRIRLGMY